MYWSIYGNNPGTGKFPGRDKSLLHQTAQCSRFRNGKRHAFGKYCLPETLFWHNASAMKNQSSIPDGY